MKNHTVILFVVMSVTGALGDPSCECGLENNLMISPSGRRSPLLYPWMGSLIEDGTYFCGAILISKSNIMTAANCVQGKDSGKIQVVLGVHNHNKASFSDKFNISHVKIHPDFTKEADNRYTNDLAIITLGKPVTYDHDLRPICLSTKDGWNSDDSLNAVGWGQMSSNKDDVAKVLMQVDIPVIENKKCSEVWGFDMGKSRICAGGGPKNVCRGDEGGALMYRNEKSSRWTLAGITSFSGPVCGDKYPGVFSRISTLMDWVVNETKDLNLCNENQV